MRTALLLLLTALSTFATQAFAQATYVERFDDLGQTDYNRLGPQALTSRGWTFRNQSAPSNSAAFFAGILPATNSIYFSPQSGAGYLASSGVATSQFGGTLSAWAILPAIPNQRAGDAVTLWTRSLIGDDQLEVRYSPTGATGTGSSVTDIGSFTTLLIDINPAPVSGWTTYAATLPGTGRIALRYRGVREFGAAEPYIGIDTLSVGAPPVPPCNMPPVPSTGQTVTWTAAASPYRVCQNFSIPAGATVNVQPGVTVAFDAGVQAGIAGTLNIQGTGGARDFFSAPNAFPPFIAVIGGTLNAQFADFGQHVHIGPAATVLLSDCRFAGAGDNLGGGMLLSDDAPVPYPFVRLERCTFTGSNLTLSNCLAVLRGNTFTDTYALLLRTLADVTSTAAPNTFSGRPLQIDRQDSLQPLRVDGVRAFNIPADGAVSLNGGAYLLGPGNSLQSSQYPLALDGGLMRGSTVPAAGNTVNAINVHEAGFAGYGDWPNLGIPYRITEPHASLPGGDINILPGTVVEALPGTGILTRFERRVVVDGLPEAPITFRAVNPAQPWQGLAFNSNGASGPRLDHVDISGANIGIVSSDNTLYLDNALLHDNTTGASTGSGAIIFGKTRFIHNQTGGSSHLFLNNLFNPNSFENNAAALFASENAVIDARNVWWNSPTGPQHPSNPGGSGELITGAPWLNNVQVVPFLTQKPDHADTPPVVRLTEPGLRWSGALPSVDYLLEPGQTYILRWEARDNRAITSQRIVLSPDGHYPDRFTISLADNLPPTQRSFAFTVPEVGFAATFQPQFIRVVAVDDAGQESFAQTPCTIPSNRLTGSLTLNESPFAGQTFRPGDTLPDITWTGAVSDFPTYDAFIVLDSDGAAFPATTVSNSYAHFYQRAPFVSTDAARIAVRARGNSNDVRWFFGSQTFSIRHDARMQYAIPGVQLTSPAPNASFAGGATVPVTWSVNAPEGVYSFDLQASYDSGRAWHPIVRDLPASARSYAWALPTTLSIPNTRLRIITRDLRFQNSSATAPIVITPGTEIPPTPSCGTADFNRDGDVGTDQDIEAFFRCLAGDCCPTCFTADFNADGDVGTDQDIEAFFRVLAGGNC